jgi:hypothetical protein
LLLCRTVKKISIYGGGWARQVLSEISAENLPQSIGGVVDDALCNRVDFPFDVRPECGALWYPGAPTDPGEAIAVGLPEVRARMRGNSAQNMAPAGTGADDPDRPETPPTASRPRRHEARAKDVDRPVPRTEPDSDISDFDHFRAQPWLSRLSLRFRRALSALCQLYVDPVVYYCLTYKLRFAVFLLAVLWACWACRGVFALMIFPCAAYIALGALV